jgi:GGDEF domain-containing protein
MNDEEALKKVNEELRRLNRLKSEFIATVSHELRTPLAVIKEFSTIMFDEIPGKINNAQKEYLGIINDNIDRLTRLVDNLLDISKIEAHKVELKRELTDIVKLAKMASSGFEPFAKNKKLEMRYDFPGNKVELYIDKDAISEVFINLLSNAVKFTEKGHIEISIVDKEKEVECAVSDTGIAISEENMPKIFGKFEQFGRLEGPGEKGTGLGLTISKSLIELHHGNIRVESKPGHGTRFTFTLPKYTLKQLFREYVTGALKEAGKYGKPLSTIIFEIKNYDAVNKELGTDKAIALVEDLARQVGTRLRRKADIAMWDTRHILAMLPDTDKDGALATMERLKPVFDDYKFREKLGIDLEIASMVLSFPKDIATKEEYLKKVPL